MSIRIISTSNLVGDYVQQLGQYFPDLAILPYGSPSWRCALGTTEALIIMLSHTITESDIHLAPNLKVIGTYSVGTNHIPLDLCKSRGICVVNTPDVLTDATADLTLAILLALTRKLKEGEAIVRTGNWTGWTPDQNLGTGLSLKICGILGSGPIGKAVAKRVSLLGMKPFFWARDNSDSVDFGTGIAERLPLKDLLIRSDVLSIHCPLTNDTRNLLSKDVLSYLPYGAFIINTARGGILDEDAAISMLHQGHLGGVGLDVYNNEPNINSNWFSAPRTIMLPHIGSATIETRNAMAKLLCDNIKKVLVK